MIVKQSSFLVLVLFGIVRYYEIDTGSGVKADSKMFVTLNRGTSAKTFPVSSSSLELTIKMDFINFKNLIK